MIKADTYHGYIYLYNLDTFKRSATINDSPRTTGDVVVGYTVALYNEKLEMTHRLFSTHTEAMRYAIEYVNEERS